MSNQEVNPVKEMPIIPVYDMEWLVGRVLTQIEAVIPQGNPALIKLIKQDMWSWYNQLPGYTTILQTAKCNCKGTEACDSCSLVVANEIDGFDENGIPEVSDIPKE